MISNTLARKIRDPTKPGRSSSQLLACAVLCYTSPSSRTRGEVSLCEIVLEGPSLCVTRGLLGSTVFLIVVTKTSNEKQLIEEGLILSHGRGWAGEGETWSVIEEKAWQQAAP